MPPKLPKKKSRKHAEGCICENCFTKRGIQKVEPVHLRFSKNVTETEDSDSPPTPTTFESSSVPSTSPDGKIIKKPETGSISHLNIAQNLIEFHFCRTCRAKQLRREIFGPGCTQCRRNWRSSCYRDNAELFELLNGKEYTELETILLEKCFEEVDDFLRELNALPFESYPLSRATRKYYGKVGLSRKNGGSVPRPRREWFVSKFSEVLKIHQGPNGDWLCCKNRADKAVDVKLLSAYLRVSEWRARQNGSNSAEVPTKSKKQKKSQTNSTPTNAENEVSRSQSVPEDSQETDEAQQIMVQNIKKEKIDPDEEETGETSRVEAEDVEQEEGSDDNDIENESAQSESSDKNDQDMEVEVDTEEPEPISDECDHDDEDDGQRAGNSDDDDNENLSAQSESSDKNDEDMEVEVDTEEPNGDERDHDDGDDGQRSGNNAPSDENSDHPVDVEDVSNNPASSDSDVESIISPTKRKAPHTIILDDSDVEKSERVSRKRIRVPECNLSINMLDESEPKSEPKRSKKLKTKKKPSYLKTPQLQPKPNSDDSDTDPEFMPISSDQEEASSESEDYESVASSDLSEDEDEEETPIQIVSDDDSDDDEEEERPSDPRINPIVILETVSELLEKSNAKDAAYRAEKKQERDREDFEYDVLGKLPFSRCPLLYAVDVISKELGWDKFPFGAKVLNRGRIKSKHMKNPNIGSWLKIKRQFVMRHFKTALSITPCRGQWYCCRNRVDKMKNRFKIYLSRYWNITA